MTNEHQLEGRIAQIGAAASSLLAVGLVYTSIRTYDKQRTMPISLEAGNARMATYLELTATVFLFYLGQKLYRASTESFKLAREQALPPHP